MTVKYIKQIMCPEGEKKSRVMWITGARTGVGISYWVIRDCTSDKGLEQRSGVWAGGSLGKNLRKEHAWSAAGSARMMDKEGMLHSPTAFLLMQWDLCLSHRIKTSSSSYVPQKRIMESIQQYITGSANYSPNLAHSLFYKYLLKHGFDHSFTYYL